MDTPTIRGTETTDGPQESNIKPEQSQRKGFVVKSSQSKFGSKGLVTLLSTLTHLDIGLNPKRNPSLRII